jgi:hypothetical protein
MKRESAIVKVMRYLLSTIVAELMVQPSSWVETEITVQMVRGLRLFKFTEELQERLESFKLQRDKDITLSDRLHEY